MVKIEAGEAAANIPAEPRLDLKVYQRSLAIFEGAVKLLEEKGWVGGPGCLASDGVGPSGELRNWFSRDLALFTPYGAIRKAASLETELAGFHIESYSWLRRHVLDKYGMKSLYDWNTREGASKEACLEDMNEVIEELKGKIYLLNPSVP